jgi:hypothetical protein
MAVCLHCLHNARVEARERRRRTIVRFSAWTLSLTVVGVVGTAAVNAAMHPAEQPRVQVGTRHVAGRPAATPKRDSTLTVASASVVEQQGAPASATPIADSTTTAPITPVVSAPAVATAPAAPVDSATRPSVATPPTPLLRPVIPQGRTDLPDSVWAERRADTVVVHFDTSPARTRRADKFEAIVRQTLRAVYGAAADSLLAAVPDGQLVSPNELLTKLPSKGIHLSSASGARIQLWPETRPGRDGPLVVAYRTVVAH